MDGVFFGRDCYWVARKPKKDRNPLIFCRVPESEDLHLGISNPGRVRANLNPIFWEVQPSAVDSQIGFSQAIPQRHGNLVIPALANSSDGLICDEFEVAGVISYPEHM